MSIGLMTPSAGFRPLRYPWAEKFWRTQEQIHWLPEEVPLGEDVNDWANRLSEGERNLLTQIFRFFTQGDIEVADNYMERYSRVFKPIEVKMMLAAFTNAETIHIAAYALLLETVGMPDSEFQAFMEYDAMRAKHDYAQKFNTNSVRDTLLTLAFFGGFSEGLQLFASFAMLMNFPRHNKMKGMGQIVSWSIRDEQLHCDGIITLFRTMLSESRYKYADLAEEITNHCRAVVEMEDRFIDLAFEMGPVEGMTPADVKQYIRFIADLRLQQLGGEPIYGAAKNPLPWIQTMVGGLEHANFFEARATEYAKAASKGTWPGVWAALDKQG